MNKTTIAAAVGLLVITTVAPASAQTYQDPCNHPSALCNPNRPRPRQTHAQTYSNPCNHPSALCNPNRPLKPAPATRPNPYSGLSSEQLDRLGRDLQDQIDRADADKRFRQAQEAAERRHRELMDAQERQIEQLEDMQTQQFIWRNRRW